VNWRDDKIMTKTDDKCEVVFVLDKIHTDETNQTEKKKYEYIPKEPVFKKLFKVIVSPQDNDPIGARELVERLPAVIGQEFTISI